MNCKISMADSDDSGVRTRRTRASSKSADASPVKQQQPSKNNPNVTPQPSESNNDVCSSSENTNETLKEKSVSKPNSQTDEKNNSKSNEAETLSESVKSNVNSESNSTTMNDPNVTDKSSVNGNVNTQNNSSENGQSIVEKTSDSKNKNVANSLKKISAVPELDETSTSSGTHPVTAAISSPAPTNQFPKTKIKLNKIEKKEDDDDDIQEVPVVKPKVDVIDVADEDVGDTEVVSEDELPPPPDKEKVDGAEEVSDEELPAAPKPDLPPEAEDVSEDELMEPVEKKKKAEDTSGGGEVEKLSAEDKKDSDASSKDKKAETADEEVNVGKRKLSEESYDPSSPTDTEVVAKKPHQKSPVKEDKRLPELDKYWKTVKDDPSDFTGWTYLLQYVDQENHVEAAEEAYSAFLSHYPYCYGYWRKYADYEKKKGTRAKCEEIFHQGLKAIPISVDLWVHYLNYCRVEHEHQPDFIRQQYETAVEICGLEFRSDRLWDSYIKWEMEKKEYIKTMALFDRVLRIPLQGHTTHFENFQHFVEKHSPKEFLSVDEFLQLRKEVLPTLKKKNPVSDDIPPGAEEDEVPPGEETFSTEIDVEESNAIKEIIVAVHRKVHKENAVMVAERWSYEEGIKRPYFHVKPLEKCQLKNWKDYLDFEIGKGDQTRIIVLFERCLIACALYEEFWFKFVEYLQEKSKDVDKIRDVFQRCCTVHHRKKVAINLEWASFEEINGNLDKSREILEKLSREQPKLIELAHRRISFEKRHNLHESAEALYKSYLSQWKGKENRHYFDLSIKYARFCTKILKDVDKAIEVLEEAIEIEKDAPNLQDFTRLHFQLIDNALQKSEINPVEVVQIFDRMCGRPSLLLQQKFLILHRKLEFLEEFGKDVVELNKTIKEFQKTSEQMKKIEEFTKLLPTLPQMLPPTSVYSGGGSKKNKKDGNQISAITVSKKAKLENNSGSSAGSITSNLPPPPPTNPMGGNYYGPQPPSAPFMPQAAAAAGFNTSQPPPNAYTAGPSYPQFPDQSNANMYNQWYNQYGSFPQNWQPYGPYTGPPPPHRF